MAKMNERLKQELKTVNPRRSLIAAVLVLVCTWLLAKFVMPQNVEELGAWTWLPCVFMIVYIFATKRIMETLILSSLMGIIMCGHWNIVDMITSYSDILTETILNEDMVWLIIVCGLMGGIIAMIEISGGARAFGNWAAKLAKTERSSLMLAWILGVVIFIDDYLNSMTVGSCMVKVTDKHKVPREMLAYVVDSTAAPLCVLIPISTWAAYCGKLLEINGWAPEGQGLVYFIKTIPFDFYGWLAAICVPLVIFGVVPKFGPMKKAYERVAAGGPLAPEGSEKISLVKDDEEDENKKYNMLNLFLPVGVLVAATCIFDMDLQMGVIVTVAFCFVFYLIQKAMTAEQFADCIMEGLKNMMLPLLLMVLAYHFSYVNDELGFTEFAIGAVANGVPRVLIPVVVYGVLAVTQFITGTNWGMYVIALPIVIPLAQQTGLNMAMMVSTVLSAGVLGSHVCFYSDATVLTSAACGCDNFQHSITQAPYGILCGVVTGIIYLVLGFVM